MPSGRHKKLVDTWGEDELKKSMKEARSERSKDSKSKHDGERDDRERRRPREDHGSRDKSRHGTRDQENGIEVMDNEKDHKKERRRHKKEDESSRKQRHEKRDEERSKSGKYADDREERKPRKDRSDDKTSKEGRRRHRDEEDDKGSSKKTKERRHRNETEEERQIRKKKEREERKKKNGIDDEDVKKESERQQLANTTENNYDDDDFEDYDDDDFEEDNDNEDGGSDETPATNSEFDELRRAMAKENEATIKSLEPSISSSQSSRASTSRTGRTFVNFVAAKQRQISDKVSQKTRKRGQELMTLLDLDVVSFDLLDMAPVNEYDLYIRSFGQSNSKQAYVQCNEDNLEREIQTDEIEVDTKWTQHPADDFKGCGGESLTEEETKFKGEDSMQLTRFLDKGSRAICTLLEEEAAANHCSSSLQSSNLCFSKGFTHLNTEHAFLEGREVLQVRFHPVQTMLMITAHSLPRLSNSKVPLSTCGVICYWNLNMPIKPQRVLSCQSSISCCCFTKTSSVFAGTVDGSVVAWDLREPSNMHSSIPLTEGMVEVQSPTYSTDGICNDDNHHSSVVSLQAVDSITDTVQSAKDEGMAFQLASMEQNGQVNFWVVIEIEKPDISGSESDLGLIPGGKIKLMKSSTVVLKGPRRDVSQLSVRHLHFSQTDANHFYVATDAGYIMHCTRNGNADIPRLYHTNIDFPVDILTVDFHPFGLPYFLVGCRDGCIRLHHTKSEFPVITWSDSTNGMDLVTLSWSRSRPAVFYSVDITAKMFIWDLLKSDSNPIRTEQFNHRRLKCLSLSNDHTATRTARSEREPEIALSNEKGTVEIHRLNEQFSKADKGELTQCKQLLQSLM